MKSIPSPNFNDRDPKVALTFIVVHGTGMKDATSALKRMCDPTTNVSAHYLIDEDGSGTQLVDEAKRAWHAGKSKWGLVTDLNSASIGIELVHPGHEHGYRGFPQTQIDALKRLLSKIVARHSLDARRCLLAHSDIAPTRKTDPGELFPWQEMAQSGFGHWPYPSDYHPGSETEALDLLASIGYDISSPRESLLAFQRHYHPTMLTGEADPETLALLRAVKALLV